MSSGQKHRDPWNFPNMKWRARKRLTGRQRLATLRRSQRISVVIRPDTRPFKRALLDALEELTGHRLEED
jgi:hypothetical protein